MKAILSTAGKMKSSILESIILVQYITECTIERLISFDATLFEGFIHDASLWIETMNILLDEDKVLCLSNKECISR